MSKRRVTSEQMATMLNQPYFNNNNNQAEQPLNNDPISTMPMVLEVMQVKQYDKNPRKAPNSEYEALYESIKVNGLDQAITITKRPGEAEYMVYSGGNTRLQIIQRLWKETQDAKYKTAHFVFKPWEKEEDTLLAHLRENDQRGELNFIDRAAALLELRNLLREEGSVTSDSKFAEYVKEAGYSITRPHLPIYWFAAEELYDWLPSLLNNGMGRDKARTIYRFKQAYLAACEYLEVKDEDEAELYFYTEVERLDNPEANTFDEQKLWGDLIDSLCHVTDKSLATCGIVLTKALQDKNSLKQPLPELEPRQPVEETEEIPSNYSDAEDEVVNSEFTEASFTDAEVETNDYSDAEVELEVETPQVESDAQPSAVALALEANTVNKEEVVKSGYSFAVAEMLGLPLPQLPTSITELRKTCFELASQLLENTGLNPALVQEIPTGAGFYLLPITTKSISDDLEAKPNSKRWLFALHTWLELTDFSGQFSFGSTAHQYIPAQFTENYPHYTNAMIEAETTEVVHYELEDWGGLQEEGVPYLSCWLGRETRVQRFVGEAMYLSRQKLATYFQLIEVYRALNTQLKGKLWEDQGDV